MALLFPRRILIALIVPVMSGIVRFSPCSHPPLHCTALHNLDSLLMYLYQENNSWNPSSFVLACFCIFFICWTFVHCSGALNLPTHQMKYTRFHGCLGCPVQVFMFQLYLQCVSWLLENWVASNQSTAFQTRSNERPPFPHPLCWECQCYT